MFTLNHFFLILKKFFENEKQIYRNNMLMPENSDQWGWHFETLRNYASVLHLMIVLQNS